VRFNHWRLSGLYSLAVVAGLSLALISLLLKGRPAPRIVDTVQRLRFPLPVQQGGPPSPQLRPPLTHINEARQTEADNGPQIIAHTVRLSQRFIASPIPCTFRPATAPDCQRPAFTRNGARCTFADCFTRSPRNRLRNVYRCGCNHFPNFNGGQRVPLCIR
jgi:hypothetical protein